MERSATNPKWYSWADALIREKCDLVLNHTTARAEVVPVETVTRYLLETPQPGEMVSLNLGYGVRWEGEAGRPARQERAKQLRRHSDDFGSLLLAGHVP